jgi:D-arabinose 1-dehydrogenase-like Zn-dependent alcohol dehydrogenase
LSPGTKWAKTLIGVTPSPFDRTLQAVQQQVDADLELVSKVVVDLHDSLGGRLREVGILSGWGLSEYGSAPVHVGRRIAKAYGARVTGVASGAKLDLLRTIGADDVIDYRREDFTDGTHRFDVVVDIAGNRPLRRLRRALTRNGKLVVTGGENGGPLLGGTERNLAAHLLSPFVTQRLRAFVVRNRAEDVATVGALIAEGVITPAVDRTFSLDEAAAAVRYLVDGRVRGKLVIAL